MFIKCSSNWSNLTPNDFLLLALSVLLQVEKLSINSFLSRWGSLRARLKERTEKRNTLVFVLLNARLLSLVLNYLSFYYCTMISSIEHHQGVSHNCKSNFTSTHDFDDFRGTSRPKLCWTFRCCPQWFIFFKNLFYQNQCKYAMDIGVA